MPTWKDLPQIPSDAFGDGSHPTTRLCAGAVETICRLERPESVLDVGTGTGILARIARIHGSSFIRATDIDPGALRSAEANIRSDQSAVAIPVSADSPDHWGARFDLVIANILEEPLRFLCPALAAAIAPNGTLLLSGFTPFQEPTLILTFESAGLRRESGAHLEGWSLLRFRKPRLD